MALWVNGKRNNSNFTCYDFTSHNRTRTPAQRAVATMDRHRRLAAESGFSSYKSRLDLLLDIDDGVDGVEILDRITPDHVVGTPIVVREKESFPPGSKGR